MSHRFTLEALKELIVARRDGAQCLQVCIEESGDPALRAVLLAHQRDCALALQELQSLFRLLGGNPDARAKEAAAAHRRAADLRAALACNGDGFILEVCERGESRALEVYRNALDDPLPELVRATVLRQFEDVMTNHDQIRALRSRSRPCVPPGAGRSAQAGSL